VLFPYALDSDVKLWLTGLSGGAAGFVFGQQASAQGAKQALAQPNQAAPDGAEQG
jgi:hypothetical protein